jgi:putative Ca2+/H+ antiporter (TMEM165/GDT1 family)
MMMSAMLEDAHKALEAMSVATNAIKDEEWGEAERALITVQEFVARLLREVGDKTQEELFSPKPEKGDRG